jgi:hypothetical protein
VDEFVRNAAAEIGAGADLGGGNADDLVHRRSVSNPGAPVYSGWRTTGRRAAAASSSRRTGVV